MEKYLLPVNKKDTWAFSWKLFSCPYSWPRTDIFQVSWMDRNVKDFVLVSLNMDQSRTQDGIIHLVRTQNLRKTNISYSLILKISVNSTYLEDIRG